MTRLEKIYKEKVIPVLQKEFNYKSPMQLPGIEKISLNIGLGASTQNNKLMEEAVEELTAIAGQKAVVTRAKKSIANFKVRQGMPIGVRVTLRKDLMWDFLDKLMNFALPRVRDFRGIPDRGFDGRGNFTLGIKEHTIFPEMEADRVENPKGMNITIVTTATTDKDRRILFLVNSNQIIQRKHSHLINSITILFCIGKVLLDQLGMPFKK